jgi:hypothetical protein
VSEQDAQERRRCSGWILVSHLDLSPPDVRVQCGREPHSWDEKCQATVTLEWGGDD